MICCFRVALKAAQLRSCLLVFGSTIDHGYVDALFLGKSERTRPK